MEGKSEKGKIPLSLDKIPCNFRENDGGKIGKGKDSTEFG